MKWRSPLTLLGSTASAFSLAEDDVLLVSISTSCLRTQLADRFFTPSVPFMKAAQICFVGTLMQLGSLLMACQKEAHENWWRPTTWQHKMMIFWLWCSKGSARLMLHTILYTINWHFAQFVSFSTGLLQSNFKNAIDCQVFFLKITFHAWCRNFPAYVYSASLALTLQNAQTSHLLEHDLDATWSFTFEEVFPIRCERLILKQRLMLKSIILVFKTFWLFPVRMLQITSSKEAPSLTSKPSFGWLDGWRLASLPEGF